MDEAQELAVKIANLGHEPFIYPLFEIILHKDIDPSIFAADAFIITSRNAFKAINAIFHVIPDEDGVRDRGYPKIFAVGKQTVNFAESLGFKNVIYAGKNVEELRETISAYPKLKFIYLSGQEITDDFSDLGIKREILYHTKPLEHFSVEFLTLIKSLDIKMMLFFSSRTVDIFMDFIKHYKLESYCSNIIALGLSKKIEAILSSLEFRQIYTADEPLQEDIIKLISKVK